MKTIDKIIESQEAPKDKNVLWVNGDKLLAMVKGKWTPIGGGSSDNVQGGGSSEEGSANIEYLDTSNADQDMIKGALLGMGLYAHISLSASMNWTAHLTCAMVAQLATIENSFDKVLAIAIDFSARVRQFGGDFMTAKEYLIMSGVITQADIDAIPRITKEQFYTF